MTFLIHEKGFVVTSLHAVLVSLCDSFPMADQFVVAVATF